jgi:hypothetical protein
MFVDLRLLKGDLGGHNPTKGPLVGCTDDGTLAIVPICMYTHLGLISWRITQIESQMLQSSCRLE